MSTPQGPIDNELVNIINKLANFVARNGPDFEKMTQIKQINNPKFSFLIPGDEYYSYYQFRVNEERRSLMS
jgi:calcium homeostasis endoplasmic reticulum protein